MDEEKIKCIYYIKDLRTDNIIYIGQTKDFKQRKYCHFGHKKEPVDKYMYEEGRENFTMNYFKDIDCTNMTDDEILNKEDVLILNYNTINNGFNKYRSGKISNDMKEYKKNYMREYQKEYHREYMKKYYQEHKEYMKKYYQEHKEKYIEHSRQWRLKKKQEKMALSEG